MKRLVIFINDGMIQDVLTSSKEPTQIMVVDFDRKTLDQSVLEELDRPYDFEDFAALADIYAWEAAHDPKKVKEVFATNPAPLLTPVAVNTPETKPSQ